MVHGIDHWCNSCVHLAHGAWRLGRGVDHDLGQLGHHSSDRGVARFVLAHGGHAPDLAILRPLAARPDLEVLVAGGVTDLDGIRRLRDAGIAGIILGETLLSGAIDFTAAMEAAA